MVEKWMKITSGTIELLSPTKTRQNEDIITRSSRVPTPPLRDIVTFAGEGFLLLMVKNDTSVIFSQKGDALEGISV